jgi:hypothetical protein
MNDLLHALRGKTVEGAGAGLGEFMLFFTDSTMLRVKVEPRELGEAPRDVLLTLGPTE